VAGASGPGRCASLGVALGAVATRPGCGEQDGRNDRRGSDNEGRFVDRSLQPHGEQCHIIVVRTVIDARNPQGIGWAGVGKRQKHNQGYKEAKHTQPSSRAICLAFEGEEPRQVHEHPFPATIWHFSRSAPARPSRRRHWFGLAPRSWKMAELTLKRLRGYDDRHC